MQTKAEKEAYLEMIKNGELDIIVGTHSLLGNRVVYNNLGLLVVDEEQVYYLSAINVFLLVIIVQLPPLSNPMINCIAEVWCQTEGEDCFF